MTTLLTYAIESSICLALFIALYHLLLSRDTRHRRNRIYLLSSLTLSSVLPLLNIEFSLAGNSLVGKGGYAAYLPEMIITSVKEASAFPTLLGIMQILYVAGVTIVFLIFIASSLSLILLVLLNRKAGSRIITFNTDRPTCFSAFGYIFISSSIVLDDAERMIRHEKNHIRMHHSFDLVLSSLILCFQWFNPAVYIFRRSLEAVHEYEADQQCLENGEEKASYQSLIFSATFGANIPIITNKFSNSSLLKKRLIMMTKKRSGSLSSVKLLAVVPLMALMFFAFSCKEKAGRDQVANATVEQKSEAANVNDTEVDIYASSADSSAFAMVEQMPVFPGGDKALLSYIYENISYPDKAKENNIQGRVICEFDVDIDGKVTNCHIVKGVDPLLDKAAYDVIKTMPDFKPGMQDGKPVKVRMALPVSFALK